MLRAGRNAKAATLAARALNVYGASSHACTSLKARNRPCRMRRLLGGETEMPRLRRRIKQWNARRAAARQSACASPLMHKEVEEGAFTVDMHPDPLSRRSRRCAQDICHVFGGTGTSRRTAQLRWVDQAGDQHGADKPDCAIISNQATKAHFVCIRSFAPMRSLTPIAGAHDSARLHYLSSHRASPPLAG